jgi:predicted DNA-binding transcriptional regulator YafY
MAADTWPDEEFSAELIAAVGNARGSNSAHSALLRRLTILERLTRGPATRRELLEYVRARLGEGSYGNSGVLAVRRDMDVLQNELECSFEPIDQRRWRLVGLGKLGLLTLDDDELLTVAQLQQIFAVRNDGAFSDHSLPLNSRVTALLQRFLLNAGHATRLKLAQTIPTLKVVGPRTRRQRPELAETIRALELKCGRTQVAFRYRSLHTREQEPVRHEVYPYTILFREGQLYLEAFMLRNSLNSSLSNRWTEYRLDRIVPGSIQSLQRPLPAVRPPRPQHEVVYHLDARIAGRDDFSVPFDGAVEVARQPDGSAVVTVRTTVDLWLVSQFLLRYGQFCRVLAPERLVADLRATTRAMAALYPDEQPPT